MARQTAGTQEVSRQGAKAAKEDAKKAQKRRQARRATFLQQVLDESVGHVLAAARQADAGAVVDEESQVHVPVQRRPGEGVELEAGLRTEGQAVHPLRSAELRGQGLPGALLGGQHL